MTDETILIDRRFGPLHFQRVGPISLLTLFGQNIYERVDHLWCVLIAGRRVLHGSAGKWRIGWKRMENA